MKGRIRKLLVLAAALAGVASVCGTAHADGMAGQTSYFEGLSAGSGQSLFGRPQVVWGTSLKQGALTFDVAGTLSIRLEDLGFPDPLESLSLLVTDLDGISERLDGSGRLSLTLDSPAKLFFAVFAESDSKFSPGMYYVTASFTPVPLPAAGWLLLSALGGLGLLRRRIRAA
jgi:hypothetical protein